MRKLLITIILFYSLGAVSGQESSGILCALGSCNEQIDTSQIENLHRYGSGNILGLGNIGLSDYSMLFEMKNYHQFSWAKTQKNIAAKVGEYDVKKPFTNFAYMIGSKKEQILRLLHTQNISRQANFSFEFNKQQSDGFYLNQASNNNFFKTNVWYKTKNERYKVSLSGLYTRLFNEQNGGIEEDSIFENDTVLNRNRELLNVNLNLASSTQKKSRLELNQYYYFINRLDSLGEGNAQGIELIASIENNNRVYKDSLLNLDYYEDIYLDSISTNDSSSYLSTNVKLAYIWKNISSSKMTFSPYLNIQNTHFSQAAIDTLLLVSSVGGLFDLEKKKISTHLSGAYYFIGYRKNNIELELSNYIKLDSNWLLKLGGSYFLNSPSLDSKYYSGNHQYWSNDFVQTQYFNASGKVKSTKNNIELSVAYNETYNPIYLNSIKRMQQIEGEVAQIIRTDITKGIQLKKWNFKLTGTYQYTGGYDIYQLPELVGKLQIAKKASLFKNNLQLYFGLDAIYYSGFKAMGYSPELNNFYVSSEKLIGEYPMINIFFNGKIKSVRFFLKSTHVNAGLLGYNYFGALHYPLKDRSFQIGFSWSFLN